VTGTGCAHPEPALADLGSSPASPVWCRLCGSVCTHGIWTAPRGLVLPGWSCDRCGVFNGAGKELLTDCRGCGSPLQGEATAYDSEVKMKNQREKESP
jgi:hypothetical protein